VRLASISVAASLAAVSLFLTAPGVAPAPPPRIALVAADSADAVATVGRFRAALASGDSAAALALLAPDAIVLESGGAESRAEYRRHHLPADIEYARAVPGNHALVQAIVHGDAAWVSSTSVTTGAVKGRAIDSAGAELIVLSRRDRQAPWQIRAIHWSSRRRAS
jgi:ketosteroid isomerase-like protein